MTNTLSRTLAAAGAAVLLGAVGALTMTEPAHATPIAAGTGITVEGPLGPLGYYNVFLDGTRTNSVYGQGTSASSSVCTAVVNHMASFPDAARGSTCLSALEACAAYAKGNGNANSMTRFYADGNYLCRDV
jgi:hypothetical protein